MSFWTLKEHFKNRLNLNIIFYFDLQFLKSKYIFVYTVDTLFMSYCHPSVNKVSTVLPL